MQTGEIMDGKALLRIKIFVSLILLVIQAGCQLPDQNGNETLPPDDSVVEKPLGPLPAALVEVLPLPGSKLGVSSDITFHFNQAMDKSSVESAILMTPETSGAFFWQEDDTVTFTPSGTWAPNTEISITITTDAEAENGLAFQQGVELSFHTADYLRLVQGLPDEDVFEVDPTGAIVAVFNYPVVPLGADPATLSPAFTIMPTAEGRSEWINTSTYIFYPAPGLSGGQNYTVQLDPTLTSVDGTPLGDSTSWTFTTAQPQLLSFSPAPNEQQVRLDQTIELVFNQPMDTTSLENGFQITSQRGTPVSGLIEWAEDKTVMTFTPDSLLIRGERYDVTIPEDAKSKGGSVLQDNIGSYSFFAASELFVVSTDPESGGLKNYYQSVIINFNAPVVNTDLEDFINVTPDVSINAYADGSMLNIFGNFEAEEEYTITMRQGISDIWGDSLDQDYSLTFRGAPLSIDFSVSTYTGGGVMFVSPAAPSITARVVNVNRVGVDTGSIGMEEFIYLDSKADYETLQSYRPDQVSSSTHTPNILRNRNQQISIPLNKTGSLSPGLYWISLTPDPAPAFSQTQQFFAVVSNVHMVFKISGRDALVWALDTRTNKPVVNAPVVIYSDEGEIIGSGLTDGDGIFYADVAARDDLYSNSYAVLGSPGDDLFSLATSDWNWGISAWDFGYRTDYNPSRSDYYIYTDRPIYRPGQMVHYRVVARSGFNGRYQIPDDETILLSVRDFNGAELAGYTLPLSEYGTASGTYFISDGAQPGFYEFRVGDVGDYSYLTFQVAEYRKPEIDLQPSFEQQEVLAGAFLDAEVKAEYFFDAPVGSVEAAWDLYVSDSYFSLPGYQVGPLREWNYDPWAMFDGGGLGTWTDGGVGITDSNGTFEIDLQTKETSQIQTYTLEITITDESGLPVANRTSTTVHPDPLYIGLKSESWVGQVDNEMGFEVYVVDWERLAAGTQSMQASFSKVNWERSGPDVYGFYSYDKVLTLLSEGGFETDAQGKGRLTFTPDEPGVYELEVSSGGAVSQILFWVGGPGQALWPNPDENQLTLIPDSETYQAGDTANIFIPNPFQGEAQALVTVERGLVLSREAISLSGSGVTYALPINKESVPNVYLSVSMVGTNQDGSLDYYYGLTNLDVEPEEQILNVEVLSQPNRAGPGEPVVFTIRVSDSSGNPVQGEFSLSVVDEAVLALADPYERNIVNFFYDRQPLGVRTGISLLAAADDYLPDAGGIGGGGGDGARPETRAEFEDTAYWNASVVTGADGTAQVEVILPDNLTTWRVLVRGLTTDTRVGEALSEVVTTKELLIRPVLPRFAVVGDHLRISAVVHNNTNTPIQASMAFQIKGLQLDDPNSALQELEIPAQGRNLVEWWGVVEGVEEIEAIFSVEGGGYSDITIPENGAIPVFNYLAPQTFSTAGVMTEGGERLEVISLPQTFTPDAGGLKLEMTSSLAAVALEGLEAVKESYQSESVEYLVSRFLPNLEMMKAVREFGLDVPELQAQLDQELNDILKELESAQNYDGGWGWNYFTGSSGSNPYVSAYALLGLVRAQEMGYPVTDYRFDRAVQYLSAYLIETEIDANEYWKYDRFAFTHFVLLEADAPIVDLMYWLMAETEKLSPWAQALLALAVDEFDPGSPEAATVFSNLQANAVRSASGAHWDDPGQSWQNMSSDIFTNAVVIYALAQHDPASPLLPEAVRYLMAYRDAEGGWGSSYTTAWALMAMTEVMRGTGELGGEFAFSADLNEKAFATGEAGGAQQFVPAFAEVGIESLLKESPNALKIMRDPGTGRLYYRANLQVAQPVESVEPLNRGLTVARAYYPSGSSCQPESCEAIQSARVGDLVTVRITLTLQSSLHYLEVRDYIPAGTEILNTSLKTSQLGGDFEYYDEPLYDPRNPFGNGWGWWYFGDPAVYDEQITWNAEFLPAGTYELTYTLVVLQPGEFQVIPAQAQQLYFPEVQGTSAGEVFEVLP